MANNVDQPTVDAAVNGAARFTPEEVENLNTRFAGLILHGFPEVKMFRPDKNASMASTHSCTPCRSVCR